VPGAPRMEVSGGGSSRTFTGDTVRIGRAMDNDVVVLNVNVSRHHAELRHDGTRWELIDLESLQGTFVEGTRVDRQAIDEPVEVVVGEPSRGELLKFVPLDPAGSEPAPARTAAEPRPVPFILADPPTRKLHRRRRA
jgi:FHA domain